MIEKICMVLIFVGVAVGVGIYCRRHTGSVDGFILGGRNVGPWLSAFAFGTSYFSAVVFVGYAVLRIRRAAIDRREEESGRVSDAVQNPAC